MSDLPFPELTEWYAERNRASAAMTTLEERVARAIGTQCLFMDKKHGILAARAAIAAVHEREGACPTCGSIGLAQCSTVGCPDDPAEAMRARCEAIARHGSFPFDIDVWLKSTKKEMTALVALAIADAIAALRGKL